MKPRLFLLDGHSLAFRAFFALPLLSTSSGRYTNAVHGFASMLTKLLEEHQPEYIAVAFDKGRATVRLEKYAEYKATRLRMPVELAEQVPYIQQVLQAYQIPILEVDGYEADDIIGTLAARGEQAGLAVRIVTGDRDALQLVSPNTSVLLTRKGIADLDVYDPAAVRERYQLEPGQLVDLKALMGDSSDNIPGVPGIGEKTGTKLLAAAGTLDELLAHPERYGTKRQVDLLRTYEDQARLSQELATIVRDLALEVDMEDLRRRTVDYAAVAAIYRDLELRTLLYGLPASALEVTAEPMEAVASGEYLLVDDESASERLAQLVRESASCSLAFESEEAGPALAICPAGEPVFVVKDLDQHQALLNQLLRDQPCLIGHDVKSLTTQLAAHGLVLPPPTGDTLLAAYLLDPGQADYSLPHLLEQYLNKGLGAADDSLARLAAEAAAVAPLLQVLEEELADKKLEHLYRQIELPLAAVLASMEIQGVQVDQTVLSEMQADMEGRLAEIMDQIYRAAGDVFNINSPKQLGQILFEKLRLPVIKKTKTGYSTDAEVLEALAEEHEVVSKILEFRQLTKLKSTYLDGLLHVVDPADSKVHTTYNQTVTTTGRLSSSEPNLQNIPVRMEEGREIRKAFIPADGFDLILAADYSQIELRVLAHISQDPILLKAFLHDEDVHVRTASEVFGVAPELVSPEMRSQAKAVNFGIVYGISDYGLSRDLKISRAEARDYIDRYFKRYAGVKNYIDRVISEARENGFVTTLMNRRRYLPDIRSRNFHLRSFAERTAMNTPIQGSAADLIKLAMVNIASRLRAEGFRSKMILQVHDELIFEVPEAELQPLAELVRREMETAIDLLVPLKVDVKVGTNWFNVAPYSTEGK